MDKTHKLTSNIKHMYLYRSLLFDPILNHFALQPISLGHICRQSLKKTSIKWKLNTDNLCLPTSLCIRSSSKIYSADFIVSRISLWVQSVNQLHFRQTDTSFELKFTFSPYDWPQSDIMPSEAFYNTVGTMFHIHWNAMNGIFLSLYLDCKYN